MKILIVDDENNKVQSIREIFIREKISVDIEVATGINEAVKKIHEEKYGLMIVDMCLPYNFGEEIEENGGISLINIIRNDKRLKAPNEIIVLTAHREMIQKYTEEIKSQSFEMILYSTSSVEWKTKITDKLKYLIRLDESPIDRRKYNYDVAVITAVSVEHEAVMKLSDWKKVKIQDDSTVYYESKWEKEDKILRVIHTSLTQMGMVAAATITTKIIYNFIPRFIIMPGIAGGVKEEYEFGDIIIPREVKDYCSGKYTTSKENESDSNENPIKYFVPTATSISTDFDVINKLSEGFDNILSKINSDWPNGGEYKVPKIRTGNMASGDSVIQNSSVINMMIKNHLRQADGLDMEAYGVYYASQQAVAPKPIPICMKAISDFANKDKSNEHQSYAAYTSAQFAKAFALEYIGNENG